MRDLPLLARTLLETLSRDPGRYGLQGNLRADYVPNPGSFTNANFTVTDGRTRRHVKLSPEAADLERWFGLRDVLRDRYRSPEILGQLEVAGLSGLVFPHLPGHVPTDDLLPEITDLANRIHGDRDLASRLESPAPPTLHACYFTGIFECLSEDLRSVKADPEVRVLLSADDLRFAEAEVDRLRALGEARISDERATSAIHGDLWLQNVLASGDEWWLLDWDSVRIGDPAGEYASLLHEPTGRHVDPRPLLPDDADGRERFDVWLRAYCFDEIVDPLSDLTETPSGLADRDGTWRARIRRSERALARYRRTYL